MTIKKSTPASRALARELAQLEREAMDEAILAMAESAPPEGGGFPLKDYEAAGWAGAMTLLVYARRIAHVESGVRT